jgi:hypothetical protein
MLLLTFNFCHPESLTKDLFVQRMEFFESTFFSSYYIYSLAF